MLTSTQRLGLGAGIFIVAGAALYAGYDQLKKRDFAVICEAYTTAPADAMSDDPATVAFSIATAIDGNTITKPARQAVNAIAMAEPSQKYELMKAAAASVGLPNWECPAMRDFQTALASGAKPADTLPADPAADTVENPEVPTETEPVVPQAVDVPEEITE